MKTRLASAAASLTTCSALLAVTQAPATAIPVDPAAHLMLATFGVGQNPSADTVYSADALFATAGGAQVPPGTTATTTFSSCGQTVQSVTRPLLVSSTHPDNAAFLHYFNESNTPDMSPNAINSLIGRSLDYSFVITSPGYDPYEISGSYSGYSVERPTCEEILSGHGTDPDAITVRRWSVKKGNTAAKVGKRLAVTPTRAPGSAVSYAWRVGARVVDTDRSVTVKRAYRGKKVTLFVTVSRTGVEPQHRKLAYGKAR